MSDKCRDRATRQVAQRSSLGSLYVGVWGCLGSMQGEGREGGTVLRSISLMEELEAGRTSLVMLEVQTT